MSFLTSLLDYAASRIAMTFPGQDKPARPRIKPFNDAGGYADWGDFPLVPSDLKALHARSNIPGAQHDNA